MLNLGIRISNTGAIGSTRIRTNKCTNFNANPTMANVAAAGDAAAVLSVADDAAALSAAGLSSICTSGKVYKLDNTLGGSFATAIVAGFTGSTLQHTISVYERGGTGILQNNAGTSTQAFGTSAGYVRRSMTFTPSDNFNRFAITANAGQIVYFVLNQLEEGPTATLPVIVTTGAASTVRG